MIPAFCDAGEAGAPCWVGTEGARWGRVGVVRLMACANIVPGILDFEVGLGGSSLECTYDVVLYSTFENKAALDAYAVHPTHEAIKSFIGEVRTARQCMDYEV